MTAVRDRAVQAVGLVGAAGAGYAIGAIPFADTAARAAGLDNVDLRHVGTGNPGAMNVSHVAGKKWGAIVSLADTSKGTAAAAVGRRLAGERGANVAAAAAVIGHCYPAWRGFKGGKGVATSIGQVIGTFPAYLPIDIGVGMATAALPWFKRRTEAATTAASVVWLGCSIAWWRRGWSTGTGEPAPRALPVATAVSAAVIQSRFRAESENVDAYNIETTAEKESVGADLGEVSE